MNKKLITNNLELAIKNGFTLIELLVVISIIGILASLALVSYSGAQKQTRDTQRKSDLAQYRNGLESYAGANSGLYFSKINRQELKLTDSSSCDKLMPDFISTCPGDPGTFAYYYRSDGTGGGALDAIKYVLWVELETGGFWEICSDGRSGKLATSPATGDGDEDGNCQLP